MDFRVAVGFLFLYYIRPQDWLPGFAGFNVVKPLIAIWIAALMTDRQRPKALPGLLRTPHDWMMLVYFAYVVLTSSDYHDSFMGFLPLAAYYVLTVQSLTTWERVLEYIKWTTILLTVLALIADASLFGIDLTGAAARTLANKGRLAIGTWLHDNPNALGHSVVIVIPLAYLLFCWGRSVAERVFVFPIFCLISGYCVYRTESKGAFLVGAICILAAVILGRPKTVQIGVLVAAITVGASALSFLPRMNHLDDLKSDQGVQGRLMAWQIARTVSKNFPTGKGWGQFRAYITWRGETFFKASHSSYVQLAADLGQYGVFIYMGLIWCCVRTLISLRKYSQNNLGLERCRRCAWILVISLTISGWMINREYAAEYFLLIALNASLHRLMKAEELSAMQNQGPLQAPLEPVESPQAPYKPAFGPAIAPAETSGLNQTVNWLKTPLWNHFGLQDMAVSAGLAWGVFQMWDYIMTKM